MRSLQAERIKNTCTVENIGAYRGPEVQNTATQGQNGRHEISENTVKKQKNPKKKVAIPEVMLCFIFLLLWLWLCYSVFSNSFLC